MKKLLLWFFCLMPCVADAQVSGCVKDAQTQEPLSLVSVSVFTNDTAFFGGTLTDTLGHFCMVLDAEKSYTIELSCVGYKTMKLHGGTSTSGEMGDILLSPWQNELKEVVVTAEGRKADATVERYLISEQIRKSSSNVAQMLNQLPGMRVDYASETVKIEQNTDVPVIVNGKEVTPEYVMSINPKRVKSVEVQRYPKGKYSDQPIILDIKLYDDYTGWDVAVLTQGALVPHHGNSNKETGRADVTVTTGCFNFYGGVSYLNRRWCEVSAYSYAIEGVVSESSTPFDIHHPNLIQKKQTVAANFGADWTINKKNSLSLQAWTDRSWNEDRTKYSVILDDTGTEDQLSKNDFDSRNHTVGLFYNGKWSDKVKTVADILFSYYHVNDHHLFQTDETPSLSDYIGRKRYTRSTFLLTYDITSQLTLTGSHQFIWRDYVNRLTGASDPSYQSVARRHDAELALTYSPSSKFQVMGGVRVLNVNESTLDNDRNKTNVLPNFRLYWRPFKLVEITNNSFTTVDYPTLELLSSSTYQLNSCLWYAGNPQLEALIMYYSETKIKLFNTISFIYMLKYADNEMTDIYEYRPDGLITRTMANCIYRHHYIGMYFDRNILTNLRFSLNMNCQLYERQKGELKNNGRTLYLDADLQYKLPTISVELYGGLFLRHDRIPLLQGEQYRQEEALRLGGRYKTKNGRWSFALTTILPTALISKDIYTKINTQNFSYTETADDRVNDCYLMANIRFNIGKGKANRMESDPQLEREK